MDHDRTASFSEEIAHRVVEWRRRIHANPELAFQERETAALVAAHLDSLGLEVETGVAETGVVGIIMPARSSARKAIALRADMDALPVAEETGLPFASTRTAELRGAHVPLMHACGHDAHTAILMGAATVINDQRENLSRPVKLIFQPAEEIVPEGKNGAELMTEAGVMDDVEEIYGLHVTQSLPSGMIGLRPGAAMASVDELTVEVIGRQTHGAYPWKGVDPIVVASQIVLALQTVVSRQADLTTSPAVVTIGSFHGGVRSNIIPERVSLEGTIRTLDESVRDDIHARVERTVSGIAESAGARAEVRIRRGYPVTRNDPASTTRCREILERSLGTDRVTEIPPVFGGEDVSFFLNRAPGTYFFLGARPPERSLTDAVPNHSPQFDVHESSLEIGVRALASIAISRSNS